MSRRKNRPIKQRIIAPSKHLSSVPLAERLPGTASPEQRIEQIVSQAHFSGPIPHPEIFRQYKEIIHDAPERILTVFEEDSRAARDLPVQALNAQKDDNSRAHWMAWSLVVLSFGLSFGFAWLGKDGLAGITIGTTLVAIVTGFLQSRTDNKS